MDHPKEICSNDERIHMDLLSILEYAASIKSLGCIIHDKAALSNTFSPTQIILIQSKTRWYRKTFSIKLSKENFVTGFWFILEEYCTQQIHMK